MASRNMIDGDLVVTGNVQVGGSLLPPLSRASLNQEDFAEFPVPVTGWRVFDAFATSLGAAGNDDLGVTAGTWGTGAPFITAGDLKTAGATTRRARCLVQLPPTYVAGQSVRLEVTAGMVTTAADGSCTVDLEVFKLDEDATVGGSDLVTTSAASINSTTFAAKNFDLTSTALLPGDILDVRLSVTCTDTATVTAVDPAVACVKLLCDTKG